MSISRNNEEFVFEEFQDSADASDMPCSQENVNNLCPSSSTDSSENMEEFEAVITDAELRSILPSTHLTNQLACTDSSAVLCDDISGRI